MFKLTLQSAWARKRRLLGTTFAVVLGVAFLAATLVIGDTARGGFNSAFTAANAGTDAVVRSDVRLDGGEEVARAAIPASVLDTVAEVDGVAAAAPVVEGVGQVLDAGGEPIGGDGPPTVAVNWVDEPALNGGWTLVDGRAPAAAGEVVLDRGTATTADLVPGESVIVLTPAPLEVRVVGIAAFGDEDSIGGVTTVAFTTEEAQRLLLGSTDLVSSVRVAADDIDQGDLAARLDRVLPEGLEAITGEALTEEQRADIEGDFLGFFTTGLLVFAGIALLVASFSIFNTFSILLAQRTRESALLRAVGATRSQVLASTLAESLLVGAVGAGLGLAAGIGIAGGMLALMESAGFGLPTDGLVVTGGALLVTLAIGLAVTVAGAVVPTVRASRVPPLASLRESATDQSGTSRLRVATGALLTGLGAALVLLGASGDGTGLAVVGAGAAIVVIGVVVLGPVMAALVGPAVGLPLRARGVTGDLARRNAFRNPHRTASTAAALLVGVAVVSLFTIFGASVSKSLEKEIDRAFGGDLVLEPAGGGFSGAGLAPSAVDAVRTLPEVETAVGVGDGAGTIDGEPVTVEYSRVAEQGAQLGFEVVAGDLAGLGAGELALSDDFAGTRWTVGDTVEIGFPDGTSEELDVVAIVRSSLMVAEVMVDDATWLDHDPQAAYWMAFVDLGDGFSLEDGRSAVEAALDGPAAPSIRDRDEFVEAQAASIDVLLTVVYGLLGIAILIALMGIANTLTLSMHERTRELGLLRAVGQSRSQLRAMVRWESVVVALFGTVGGLLLGAFLGWGLVRTLNAAEGFGEFALPIGPLVVVLVVGAGAGVLAALRPAWRASRLDVLAAVAAE